MPEVMPNGIVNPLVGQYGVVADVIHGDRFLQFAANFDGQVELLLDRERETVMALTLKAVDADGNALQQIRVGDSFYIEVVAEDLRQFGQGVFGVGFDLPLPTNRLALTGELILLGLWDDFGRPITPEGVDEFSAIEVLFDPPGAAPQSVVRFGVTAITGGETTLQLNPADRLGVELLLRGTDK